MSEDISTLTRVIAEQQARIDELEARAMTKEEALLRNTKELEEDIQERLLWGDVDDEVDDTPRLYYIFDPDRLGVENGKGGTFHQVEGKICTFKIGDTEVPCSSAEFSSRSDGSPTYVALYFRVLA